MTNSNIEYGADHCENCPSIVKTREGRSPYHKCPTTGDIVCLCQACFENQDGHDYNCCTDGCEPDSSTFAYLEVHPVVSNAGADGDTECETVDDEPGKADFWTVYARHHGEHAELEAICDKGTRKGAMRAAVRLSDRWSIPVAVAIAAPVQYIVRSDIPFPGHCETATLDDGTVAYSNGLTFEEYQSGNEHPVKLITEAEFDTLLMAHAQSLVSPVKVIDEKRYWYLLEVLPPCRWHNRQGWDSFHLSERLHGNIVTWAGERDGVYLEFDDRDNLSDILIGKKFSDGLAELSAAQTDNP